MSGMHRSGTSAITRVVSLLGAALPDQLIEPRDDNERGFWEGRSVVDLDRRVLERFGSWWGGWDRIDPQQLLVLTRMVESARRLVRDEFAHADLIVLKDPRISRLLPLWTRALEQEGFRCVHIVALRHPGAVAGSLARRNGLEPKAATLSWLAHSLDAELHTRTQPRVVVSFENLLRDWRSEVDRISRALAVEWPQAPDDIADAVGEFIEPGLVHESPASTLKGPVAAVTPVYDVLRRWSEDDSQPGDANLLDSWRGFLAPIRRERSAVAQMALERQEVIAELRSRQRGAGRLGSAEVWNPIQHQGFNREAAAAWAWLKRERQHSRAARRAVQQIEQLQRSPAEHVPGRKSLSRVVRRLGRRLPLPSAAGETARGRRQGRNGRGGG
ncbi:MAG TPA: hypothetical protein VFJ14_13490 [Nocardioidaceae bacterium]|nr:hypothetical protein [Nocardioidaceae bacterium]